MPWGQKKVTCAEASTRRKRSDAAWAATAKKLAEFTVEFEELRRAMQQRAIDVAHAEASGKRQAIDDATSKLQAAYADFVVTTRKMAERMDFAIRKLRVRIEAEKAYEKACKNGPLASIGTLGVELDTYQARYDEVQARMVEAMRLEKGGNPPRTWLKWLMGVPAPPLYTRSSTPPSKPAPTRDENKDGAEEPMKIGCAEASRLKTRSEATWTAVDKKLREHSSEFEELRLMMQNRALDVARAEAAGKRRAITRASARLQEAYPVFVAATRQMSAQLDFAIRKLKARIEAERTFEESCGTGPLYATRGLNNDLKAYQRRYEEVQARMIEAARMEKGAIPPRTWVQWIMGRPPPPMYTRQPPAPAPRAAVLSKPAKNKGPKAAPRPAAHVPPAASSSTGTQTSPTTINDATQTPANQQPAAAAAMIPGVNTAVPTSASDRDTHAKGTMSDSLTIETEFLKQLMASTDAARLELARLPGDIAIRKIWQDRAEREFTFAQAIAQAHRVAGTPNVDHKLVRMSEDRHNDMRSSMTRRNASTSREHAESAPQPDPSDAMTWNEFGVWKRAQARARGETVTQARLSEMWREYKTSMGII